MIIKRGSLHAALWLSIIGFVGLLVTCLPIQAQSLTTASIVKAKPHFDLNATLMLLLAEDTQSNNDKPTPLLTDIKSFIFGHSLITHDPPAIPTPSNETTVPHWMALLSMAAEYSYAADGQYGFLPQHAQLPPNPQWGFDIVPGVWDADTTTFAQAGFNNILITAANFIQYQAATQPYDGDNPNNLTPLAATLDIIDWVNQQAPGIPVYIYENWPDMGYLTFPPTTQQFAEYNDTVLNSFHQWWLDYYAAIVAARPSLNIKLIPVGPVISYLLTHTNLNQIPVTELYEDDAPHGRPTIYFLASLITYMTTYGVKAPTNFQVPDSVHSLVRDNYQSLVNDIWSELQQYGSFVIE